MAKFKYRTLTNGLFQGKDRDWEIVANNKKDYNWLLNHFIHQSKFNDQLGVGNAWDYSFKTGDKIDTVEEPIDGGTLRFLLRKCLFNTKGIGPVTEWGLGFWYKNFCDCFLDGCWSYG